MTLTRGGWVATAIVLVVLLVGTISMVAVREARGGAPVVVTCTQPWIPTDPACNRIRTPEAGEPNDGPR